MQVLESIVTQLTRIAFAIETSYRGDVHPLDTQRYCRACGCTLVTRTTDRCPACKEPLIS